MSFFRDIICTGVMRSLSKIIAPEFIGKLTGTADSAKTLDGLTSTITELNYLDGVTSNVQTQINSANSSATSGRSTIATAITNKGVSTASDASYSTMTNNINSIKTMSSTSDATAAAANILSGKTAYVNSSKITGTMTNNGAKTASLKCGGSYTIRAGYHNGSGKVTADSLSSQTSATAMAGMILKDQTAWVNGSKITGTLGESGTSGGTSIKAKSVTSLSVARHNLAGASVGNYAVFAGGATDNPASTIKVASSVVDAYNASLTRSTPTTLSVARPQLSGASVGSYALFAGGDNNGFTSVVGTVDAYNTSLTRTTPTALSQIRDNLIGASVGSYALFAGGYCGGVKNNVDAYNASLTRTTPTGLSSSRWEVGSASIGNYALFAGGCTDTGYTTFSSVVDAYNTSLTRSTPTTLSAARGDILGAHTDSYALFVGGYTGTNWTNAIDAYDSTLTKNTLTTIGNSFAGNHSGGTYSGYITSGTTVVNCRYAIFFSNASWATIYSDNLTKDYYTSSLSSGFRNACASVGEILLFAGGMRNEADSSGNYADRPVSSVVAFYPEQVTSITVPECSAVYKNGHWGNDVKMNISNPSMSYSCSAGSSASPALAHVFLTITVRYTDDSGTSQSYTPPMSDIKTFRVCPCDKLKITLRCETRYEVLSGSAVSSSVSRYFSVSDNLTSPTTYTISGVGSCVQQATRTYTVTGETEISIISGSSYNGQISTSVSISVEKKNKQLMIYDTGTVKNTSVTGGLCITRYGNNSTLYETGGTSSLESGYIFMPRLYGKWNIINTVNKINLSGYKTLYGEFESTERESDCSFYMAVMDTLRTLADSSLGDRVVYYNSLNTRVTLSIDVSDINDSRYIYVNGYGNKLYVYKLWLE